MLTEQTKTKIDEACRCLVTPDQVDATILRLHQYRAKMWPTSVQHHVPDVLRELGQIHNQLVAGDDVIISPGSHQAESIATAMCIAVGTRGGRP